MQEPPFPFYEEFVVACAYTKMPNFLDTYNTYIEYIEEASFCRLTMGCSALERYPTRRG
jgi:hypothetical protein